MSGWLILVSVVDVETEMEEQKRKNQQKAWEKQEKMIKQLKSSGISKTKAEQVTPPRVLAAQLLHLQVSCPSQSIGSSSLFSLCVRITSSGCGVPLSIVTLP
jgi:hypothetical protein